MESILVVDDNKDLCFNLLTILKDEGYNVFTTGDGKGALKAIERNSPSLVLLDIRLPEINGMKILEKAKEIDRDLVVIMLTAFADVKDAVKTMKLGAYDYITKPFDNEELILIVKRALQTQHLSREVKSLRKRLGEKTGIKEAMGESPQIKQVLKQVEIIAPTNMTVILQGDSGTGKELIANMIHQNSLRKDKPFIAIDCGAIPETLVESELFGYEKGAFTGADDRKEGKFEQVNGGTLFLDEVTNLPNFAQVKLLRVIQERKIQHLGGKKDIGVDVRIIVATNINLSEAVKAGRLRDDLFHRLNEFQINLPKLAERKDDIPVLAKYFLEEANSEFNKEVKGFSPEAMKFFFEFSWPGNVRELKNVTRRVVLLSDSDYIAPNHLFLNGVEPLSKLNSKEGLTTVAGFCFGQEDYTISFENATEEFQRNLIKKALEETNGNKLKAAELLQINRKALYRKLKKLRFISKIPLHLK